MGLGAPDMVTTVGREVQDRSGLDVATFVLCQSKPELTAILDKKSPQRDVGCDGRETRRSLAWQTTVTAHVLSGTQAAVL
jgi:hypothetical protein